MLEKMLKKRWGAVGAGDIFHHVTALLERDPFVSKSCCFMNGYGWVKYPRPHTESPQEKDLKTTCLAVYFIILVILLVTQLTKVIEKEDTLNKH
jgi:hypothetical protein